MALFGKYKEYLLGDYYCYGLRSSQDSGSLYKFPRGTSCSTTRTLACLGGFSQGAEFHHSVLHAKRPQPWLANLPGPNKKKGSGKGKEGGAGQLQDTGGQSNLLPRQRQGLR